MKKIIESDTDEGIASLLGERVTLFCDTFIYTGVLVGVNDDFVLLEDPAIAYETGSYNDPNWKDVQKLGVSQWRVRLEKIESYGVLNKK